MKLDLSDFHPAVIEASKIARRHVDLEMLATLQMRCAAQLKNGPPCPWRIIVSGAYHMKRDAQRFGNYAPKSIYAVPGDYLENGSDFLENRAVDNSDPLEILIAAESAAEKMELREWQKLAERNDKREKIFEFTTDELARKTGLTKRAIQYQRNRLLAASDSETQLQLWG